MSAALMSYVLAVAALTTAGARALRLRTGANRPAVRGNVVLLLGIGVTFLTYAPTSQAWVNQYVPDLFKLVGNISALVAMCGGSAVTSYTWYPVELARPKVRASQMVLLAVVAVMVVMFFLPHPAPLTGSFDGLYAQDWTLVVYTHAYAGYFGAIMVALTVQFGQFGRLSPGLLRVGMLTVAAGSAVGALHNVATLFILWRNVFTEARQGAGGASGVCHSAFSDLACFVAIGTPALGAAVGICGFALAASSTRLATMRRAAWRLRSYHRLGSLWRLLVTAFPDMHHSRQHLAPRPRPRSMREHLNNRVVEILDGQLLLAAYRSAALAADAATVADSLGASEQRRAAITEACEIAGALQSRTAGYQPPRTPPESPPYTADDLDEQTAWLEQVARELDTPVVQSYRYRQADWSYP